MIAIPFPPNFAPKDFVEPGPVPSADLTWYFVGYGAFDGGPVRCYVFKAKGDGTPAVLVPIDKPTRGRGSLAVGGMGKGLWLLSYDGATLIQQPVPGWTPPPWMVKSPA